MAGSESVATLLQQGLSNDFVVTARVFATLPLLFFVPGYVVLRILGAARPLCYATFVSAIGISLSLVIVAGLVLNIFGALDGAGWFIALAPAAVIGYLVLSPQRFTIKAIGLMPAVAFGAAALLAAAAIEAARAGAIAQRQFAFTELWILPADGASARTVIVGLDNQEKLDVAYALELRSDDHVVGRWPDLRPAAGERRSWIVPVPTAERRVEALLYRTDDGVSLYRRAWIDTR